MTLHYNVATEGVRAGHKFFSKLGFGFQLEITITPKDGGGAGQPSFIPDINEYLITVKITRNGKVWQKSIDANRFEMKTLERVVMTFKSIKTIIENITFQFKIKSINIKNIILKVWKK